MTIDLYKFASAFTPGAGFLLYLSIIVTGWIVKEWTETRKLSADDRLARREGYAKQVQFLTGENRAIMGDMRALREEYDKYRQLCHHETEQLRSMVMRLDGEIHGYKRRLDTQGTEIAKFKGEIPESKYDITGEGE